MTIEEIRDKLCVEVSKSEELENQYAYITGVLDMYNALKKEEQAVGV